MNIRLILFVALLSVGAAASAKKYVPVPTPLAQELPVEVILNQQEMGVDVPTTATAVGMQFGLVGALVGAAITTAQVANAEKRVAEIRNLLVDYRFNESVERAIRAKLASEGLSPNPQLTFMASPWDAESARKAGKTATKGLFTIVPRYSITSDFERMTVSLNVVSVDRTFKSNGKPKDKFNFFRHYAFQFPLSKVSGSGASDDAQRWIELGKPGLSAMLDEGVDQVVDMLVYEFSPDGRIEQRTPSKGMKATLNGVDYSGRSVRTGPNWVWIRGNGNVGVPLLGYFPVSASAVAALAPPADPVAPVAPSAPAASAAPAAPAAPVAEPAAAAATEAVMSQ